MKRVTTLLCIITAICLMSQTSKAQALDSVKQAEMMAKYMELMQPGPEHKILESLVGNWDVEFKMMMGPGMPPAVDSFVGENKMILGGRYLEINTKMSKGIMGFDRRSEKFTYVAFDDHGTYYVTAAGKYDSTSNTISMYGEDFDPLAGWTQKYYFNLRLVDPDTHIFEIIFVNPELTFGKPEFKAVEVVVRRKK